MMWRGALTAGLAIVVAVTGAGRLRSQPRDASRAPETAPQYRDATLSARVVPKVANGGTIYVIVSILNASDRPIWLNTRFVASSLGREPPAVNATNVWFDIKYRGTDLSADRCSMP